MYLFLATLFYILNFINQHNYVTQEKCATYLKKVVGFIGNFADKVTKIKQQIEYHSFHMAHIFLYYVVSK